MPWFAKAAEGMVYLVKGSWNEYFLDELGSFPESRHDDMIDSVSGAFAVLNPQVNWKKIDFLHI
jgi:predicted phage terminase large subunit-like protein